MRSLQFGMIEISSAASMLADASLSKPASTDAFQHLTASDVSPHGGGESSPADSPSGRF
jgi:hypothetical protein